MTVELAADFETYPYTEQIVGVYFHLGALAGADKYAASDDKRVAHM